MTTNTVNIEICNHIATLTINRPEALNAMNETMLHELNQLLQQITSQGDIRAIIITGSGDKAFVAGADIRAMQPFSVLRARQFANLGHSLLNQIEAAPQPVIAAINGFALGGGCELALACDIRLASTTARFGQPEVNLGIIPGFGGTQRLPRLVGKANAMEIILSGEMIDAERALAIGLVNRVVDPDQLLPQAQRLAATIASKGRLAIELAKNAIHYGLKTDLEQATRYEAQLFSVCFDSEDQKEGMQAFIEKRLPRFNHED